MVRYTFLGRRLLDALIDFPFALPLRVDKLYNEFDPVAPFASATLLAFLALATLCVKLFLEWKSRDET